MPLAIATVLSFSLYKLLNSHKNIRGLGKPIHSAYVVFRPFLTSPPPPCTYSVRNLCPPLLFAYILPILSPPPKKSLVNRTFSEAHSNKYVTTVTYLFKTEPMPHAPFSDHGPLSGTFFNLYSPYSLLNPWIRSAKCVCTQGPDPPLPSFYNLVRKGQTPLPPWLHALCTRSLAAFHIMALT